MLPVIFKAFNIQINFVDFYSFLHNIPRKWKDCLQVRLERGYIKQNLLETLLKMGKVCIQSYANMLSKKCMHRSHETKWLHVLQDHVTQLPWPSCYSVNFQCTIDSRMGAFQYNQQIFKKCVILLMMNLAISVSQVLKPLNTFYTFVLLSRTYGQN